MSDKQAALEAIGRMPDGISLREIGREIEFLAAVREGEERANQGKVIPLAEVEKKSPGMAFQVLVTELANEDLAGLVRYIAADNPHAAERFGLAIIEKLKVLQMHHLLGRMVPEIGNPVVREVIHPPYRIVYRIIERDQVVEVLRIWHGARGGPKLTSE